MTIRLPRVRATAVVAPIKRSVLRPQPTLVHLFPACVNIGGPMLCFVAMAASLSMPFVLWGMPGPGTVAVPGSQVKLARLDCRETDHGPDMTVCSGASKHLFRGMMWARSPSPRAESIIGSSGGMVPRPALAQISLRLFGPVWPTTLPLARLRMNRDVCTRLDARE